MLARESLNRNACEEWQIGSDLANERLPCRRYCRLAAEVWKHSKPARSARHAGASDVCRAQKFPAFAHT